MRTVIFPGSYESLDRISEFVRQAAQEARFDDEEVYAIDLAVEEACTNIIEHAYGGENKGKIKCTCEVTNEGLTITLVDRGQPFDPEKVPEPDPSKSIEDLPQGGAGLFLIRKMMDKVKFEFTPQTGNILTMFKRKKGD